MESHLRDRISQDPGDPAYAELAHELRGQGRLQEALEVALGGVSANPACHLGRLTLAHIFFDRGWTVLAVREVRHLCQELPEINTLKKLLTALSPGAVVVPSQGAEATVAETDFDFEEIDLIDENE